jgi:predicted RNA-binding Zn ribbon-like protein
MLNGMSRAASVPLVGGRPCLDLVNSVSWRGAPAHRREDHLDTVGHCLVWAARVGVLTAGEAEELRSAADGRVLVDSLHRLRERIAVHYADAAEPNLDALGEIVRDAVGHSRLTASQGRTVWRIEELDQRTPARRIALDLYDQLITPRGPIGRCGDESCGWVFVDTSRAHSRRWCSSADCGNRNRVRRHQARRRIRP